MNIPSSVDAKDTPRASKRSWQRQGQGREPEVETYHMMSAACGANCGFHNKNDIGATIRSMIAFGKPRAAQQRLHYHVVLSSDTFANCSKRIWEDVNDWIAQDESVKTWFKLELHAMDKLLDTLHTPLDKFDDYLINGYRSCSGFRLFLLDMEPFSQIEQILYIDTDVMMFNSVTRIAEEWEATWTEEQFLGIIGSSGVLYPPEDSIDFKRGRFAIDMNAGVLFMKLQKMRSFGFRRALKELVQKGRGAGYRYRSGDQGQLDHFCTEYRHRCRPTDCAWNLVNGINAVNATHCLKKHKDPSHAVLLHTNHGMHSDYVDLMRKENDLQWVREMYAKNVSQCQVARFEMTPRNKWAPCFPNAWKRKRKPNEPNQTIGCALNALDVNRCE